MYVCLWISVYSVLGYVIWTNKHQWWNSSKTFAHFGVRGDCMGKFRIFPQPRSSEDLCKLNRQRSAEEQCYLYALAPKLLCDAYAKSRHHLHTKGNPVLCAACLFNKRLVCLRREFLSPTPMSTDICLVDRVLLSSKFFLSWCTSKSLATETAPWHGRLNTFLWGGSVGEICRHCKPVLSGGGLSATA